MITTGSRATHTLSLYPVLCATGALTQLQSTRQITYHYAGLLYNQLACLYITTRELLFILDVLHELLSIRAD